jgi:hypothetical protein
MRTRGLPHECVLDLTAYAVQSAAVIRVVRAQTMPQCLLLPKWLLTPLQNPGCKPRANIYCGTARAVLQKNDGQVDRHHHSVSTLR